MKLGVLLAGAMSVSCALAEETFVDEMEITADTTIDVAAGDVKRIDYLWAAEPHTVTKTGEGALVLATVGTGISVDVQEGTLASVRQLVSPKFADNPQSVRIDCNDRSKMTVNAAGKVSVIKDADTGVNKCNDWSMGLPHVTDETLNGLKLLDFGALKNRNTDFKTGDDAGMMGFSVGSTREFVYVWKDRDDVIDFDNGGTEFNGPCVLGNDPSYWTRNVGGSGLGFGAYSVGMGDKVKANIYLDGRHILYTERIGRGFHLFHNSFSADKTAHSISTLGYSVPYEGGIVLAEIICYSNLLSAAQSARIDAYMRSKWFGANLAGLKLGANATLDVSAVKFDVGTLTYAEGARVVGASNFCCRAVSDASTGFLHLDGPCALEGVSPSVAFDGDAVVSSSGAAHVPSVSSGTGTVVKRGAGELELVATPDIETLKVEEGTLNVSPLLTRRAMAHLDANRTDTMTIAESDGRKFVSKWCDTTVDTNYFSSTSWRHYYTSAGETSTLVRKPYLAENEVGDLTMMDFGTFYNVNHTDGWGACLEKTHCGSCYHDVFVVFKDYPEVKDYPYADGVTAFGGPCYFGYEYNWNRGVGGNGKGFPLHTTGCPGGMWAPLSANYVNLDGEFVNGTTFVPGDGVHVLANRVAQTVDGNPGTSLQSVGGNWMYKTKDADGNAVYNDFGGIKIGEVFLFEDYLADDERMRITRALNGKWRGAENPCGIPAVEVSAGATCKLAYADVEANAVALGGTVEAKSLCATTLVYTAGAKVAGAYRLKAGQTLTVAGNATDGYVPLAADKAVLEKGGVIAFASPVPLAMTDTPIKILDCTDATLLGRKFEVTGIPEGYRGFVTVASDGVYVTVSLPNGLMFIVK